MASLEAQEPVGDALSVAIAQLTEANFSSGQASEYSEQAARRIVEILQNEGRDIGELRTFLHVNGI